MLYLQQQFYILLLSFHLIYSHKDVAAPGKNRMQPFHYGEMRQMPLDGPTTTFHFSFKFHIMINIDTHTHIRTPIFICIYIYMQVYYIQKRKHVKKIFLLRHIQMLLNVRYRTKNKEKRTKMVNGKIVKEQSRWSKITVL